MGPDGTGSRELAPHLQQQEDGAIGNELVVGGGDGHGTQGQGGGVNGIAGMAGVPGVAVAGAGAYYGVG